MKVTNSWARYRQAGVALVLALSFALVTGAADARGGGGGGGHGGFGGGGRSFGGGRDFGGDRDFGRDYGDRGYGDRGYGDRGYGDRGLDGDRSFDRDFNRDDDVLSHTSESALRDSADHVWNDGGQKSMPSDGGFSRAIAPTNGAWGHVTAPISPARMAGIGSNVRNNFHNNDAFRGDWWAHHPGAWWGRDWPYNWAWGGGWGWGDLAGYWGYPVDQEPVDYDYGDNITYQGDTVYYGSQPACSAGDYYDQALQLAQTTPSPAVPTAVSPSANQKAQALAVKPIGGSVKDWKPLGIYSMVQGDQTDSTILFQLAVDKKGEIRGNYYNALTQETRPLSGAIDKKNMRAAWVVQGSKGVVYDTGIANLLHAQSPMLVHYGKDRTEQWNLVRLKDAKVS